MKRNYFLDANVVIDFLADRKPFSMHAALLFDAAAHKKIKLFLSAVSYNNIYYILRQSMSNKQTMNLLKELTELIEIAAITPRVIQKALHADFRDFEDAIQYYCAMDIQPLDAIITRNGGDFKKSSINILSPEEVIVE